MAIEPAPESRSDGTVESVVTADEATALDELRRAEILVHTRYPKLGNWYPPTAGLTAGLWIAAFELPDFLQIPVHIIFAIVVATGAGWYQRRRGVTPKVRTAPGPIRRALVGYFVGCAVVFGGLFLLWQFAPWWTVAAIGGLVIATGVAVYEQRYAAAASRSEAEAGIGESAQTQ